MLKVMDRKGPCSEPQLSPDPPGAADWDLGWTAGWLARKKVAVRIKHELPDQCSMLAIRHFLPLRVGEESLPVCMQWACQVLE